MDNREYSMTDEGIETTTWHDQRPSHRPVPNAVTVAAEHARIAVDQYNSYWDFCLHSGDEINWPEMERLAKIANDAERALEQARHDALNECTCDPRSDMACPVCVADNKERYPDGINLRCTCNYKTGSVCPKCYDEGR